MPKVEITTLLFTVLNVISSHIILDYAKNEVPSIKKQFGKQQIYFKRIYLSSFVLRHIWPLSKSTKFEVAITELLH
jgi:hypothetical protein